MYYISSTAVLKNTERSSRYRLALIVDGDRDEDHLGLVSEVRDLPMDTSSSFAPDSIGMSLGIAGFVKLYAGEKISIEVESQTDNNYLITTFSSWTFHYIGRAGSAPAYLAQLTQNVNTAGGLTNWRTTGDSRLFRTLSGTHLLLDPLYLSQN